ncbi:MAG: mannose-1-phosphate guanylyltransferase [Flavobacteriales bacterium CG11_big_fil_rev_8_21_14_0_20_35_7]|nr:MAG: mannose-1-phosphate guanylyltransferase [Flavobacteriales bacterium CG11_big_fil_rev_8_21_14_0_20_35_7]
MKNKNYYAVIMAGGIGSRFWPMSTEEYPKQFHDMLGVGSSLLQKTFARFHNLIPSENIFISTNTRYKSLVKQQLKKITDQQLLLEPAMRNTAPCILYAALKIYHQNPDAIMIIAPSDHWIDDETRFINNVEACFKACQEAPILMTMGILPNSPNTGYGYIQFENSTNAIKKVKNFTEKPDLEMAKTFIKSGDYLWNAGIFIWSAKAIIEAFSNLLPELHALFYKGMACYNTDKEADFITSNYQKAQNISIDYGIMESSKNVFVLPVDFGWNDLGTWNSLYQKLPKQAQENAVINAKTIFREASGNLVRTTKNKLVVIQGLNDFIVVEKEGVLLICPRSKEQDIKQIVAQVKQNKLE